MNVAMDVQRIPFDVKHFTVNCVGMCHVKIDVMITKLDPML